MRIANLGAIGAGLVRGNQLAEEEKRAEEDQAFQNEQRKVWRDQMAREKEERDAVAAVRRPGEYEVRTPTYSGMTGSLDEQDIPYTTQREAVTDADYARGLARAYKYSPDKAVAALNTAGQFDERQYMLHQRKVTDAALKAQMLIDSGDHIGGMRHLGDVYRTINDGKDIVEVVGPDGQPHFGLAQGGKYIQQPQAVTPDMARQAVWSALKFATPDMFKTVSTLENQRMTAEGARNTGQAHLISAGRPVLHTDGVGQVTGMQYNPATQTWGQIAPFGARKPEPRDPYATGKPNLGTAYLPVPDTATGKVNKVPVRVATVWEGNRPVTKAWSLSGEPITDNALLSKIAAGDYTREDPEIAGIDAQIAKIHGSVTGDNFEASQTALKNLNAQKQMITLKRQVSSASPEERIVTARQLLSQKAAPEVLTGLGLTPEEIKAAKKAPAAPPSAPGSAGLQRPLSPEEGRAQYADRVREKRGEVESSRAAFEQAGGIQRVQNMNARELAQFEAAHNGVLTRAERAAIVKRRNELE